jgi:hypothetical protein
MNVKKVTLVAAVMITLALPAASQALQVGVGASTWYTNWIFESDNGEFEFDRTFIYGPILTLGFSPQWSLSGVFLYGKFKQSSDEEGPGEITRFDSDIALNYSISRYIKVFAGFKYMGYNFDNGDHAGYGPGFGLSLVMPLTDSFFLIGNFSGLYIWGHHKDEGNDSQGNDYDYTEPGYNAGVSLAYHFTGASTVISLGFRYQYFKTHPDSSTTESDLTHTFYGATLSAIYSFSI